MGEPGGHAISSPGHAGERSRLRPSRPHRDDVGLTIPHPVIRYAWFWGTKLIRSFADGDTEKAFNGEYSRKFDAVSRQARRRLIMLDEAGRLEELRSPPGNRLEALAGDRKGQHSIRVNDQWRIVFVWREDGPHHVAIVDYH